MRTEKEIRKMLKTAIRHPERFWGPDPIVTTLKWVLGELPSSKKSQSPEVNRNG